MKICLTSDSHGRHRRFDTPPADVLIFAGDIMTSGWDVEEIRDFNLWLADQPQTDKLVIAGNHDWLFARHNSTKNLITNAIYLENSGVEIGGLKFWGSPAQPEFCNWAFNYKRGEEIDQIWKQIPEDTDVLITHGPPAGYRDWAKEGYESLGCRNLLTHVKRIKPSLHVFGHIHGGYGEDHDGNTHYVNASLLNEAYQPVNKPIVVEVLPKPRVGPYGTLLDQK